MKIRLSRFAAASCAASLAWWLLNPGAASGQAPAQLAAMDYIQIQQLVNRLNFALDYCGNGGRTFAELFVAGGRYVIDRGDGQPIVRDTRDALIALAGGPGCESRRTAPSSYIPAPAGLTPPSASTLREPGLSSGTNDASDRIG